MDNSNSIQSCWRKAGVSILCILVILPCFYPQTNEMEENNVVKRLEVNENSSLNSQYGKAGNNVAFDGSAYYIAGTYTDDKIKKTTDWISFSDVETLAYLGTLPAIRALSEDEFFWAYRWFDLAGPKWALRAGYTDDDFSTQTDYIATSGEDGYDIGNTEIVIDVLTLSGTNYIMTYDGTNQTVQIYNTAMAEVDSLSSITSCGIGHEQNDKYYFTASTSTSTTEYVFDGSTIETETTITDAEETVGFYFLCSDLKTKMMVSADGINTRVYINKLGTWTLIKSSSTFGYAGYSFNDNYTLRYITLVDLSGTDKLCELYYVAPSGGLFKIHSTQSGDSEYMAGGWGNYLIDNSYPTTNMYEVSIETIPVEFCTIERGVYSSPTASVGIMGEEPSVDEGIVLYDNSDNLLFQGQIIDIDDSNTQLFGCTARSYISEDLNKKVDVTYTDKTTHYIIKDIIDNYCKFLYYDSGISTTPTDVNTITFKNTSIYKIFQWADAQEGYFTSIRPSFEVFWNQMTDSTKSVTDSTPQIGEANRKRQNQKFSKIILEGAWDEINGERIFVEEDLDPGGGEYRDVWPNASLAVLTKMMANIKSQKNQAVYQITLRVQGQGQYVYGTYYTLTNGKYSITTDSYYINATIYNALADICTIISTDILFTPPSNSDYYARQENVDEKIDQINEKLSVGSDGVVVGYMEADSGNDHKHGSDQDGLVDLSNPDSGGTVTTSSLIGGHSNVTYIDATTSARAIYYYQVGPYYSVFIYPKQTNKTFFFTVKDSSNNNVCYVSFTSTGGITFTGTSTVNIGTYSADTWYHVLIYAQNADDCKVWINEEWKATVTGLSYAPEWALFALYTTGTEIYTDRLYIGSDLTTALEVGKGQLTAANIHAKDSVNFSQARAVPINVIATRDSAQAIGAGEDFIFDDVEVDSRGAYDSTTGEFTAPEDGSYTVSATITLDGASWSDGERGFLQINNGSGTLVRLLDRQEVEAAEAKLMCLRGTADIWLNIGDVIVIYIGQNTGTDIGCLTGSGAYNHLSIHRVV